MAKSSFVSWKLHLLFIVDIVINENHRVIHSGVQAWTVVTHQPRADNGAFRTTSLHRRQWRHVVVADLARKPSAFQFDDDFYNQWNETDDDIEENTLNIQSRRELDQALGSLFPSIKSASSSGLILEPQKSYDSLLKNVDNFQSKPNSELPLKDDIDDFISSDGQETDGLFLDADAYAKSQNWLTEDGSLDLPEDAVTSASSLVDGTSFDDDDQQSEANRFRAWSESLLTVPQYPDEPSSTQRGRKKGKNKEEYTLEDLLQLQQQRQTMDSTAASVSEELHQQVFEQEQGFLAQSQVFRESLGSDSDQAQKASLEAAKLRRGANYRQRQEKLLQQLDTQLSELGALYKQQAKKKKSDDAKQQQQEPQQLCSKCGCNLDPMEVQQSVGRGKPPICRICHADALVEASSSVRATLNRQNYLNVIKRPNATMLNRATTSSLGSSSTPSRTTTLASQPPLESISDAAASEKNVQSSNIDEDETPADMLLSRLESRSRQRLRLSTTRADDKPILHLHKTLAGDGQPLNVKTTQETGTKATPPLAKSRDQGLDSLPVTSTPPSSKSSSDNIVPKPEAAAPSIKSSSVPKETTPREAAVLKSPKKIIVSQEKLIKEQEQEALIRKQRLDARVKPAAAKEGKVPTASELKPSPAVDARVKPAAAKKGMVPTASELKPSPADSEGRTTGPKLEIVPPVSPPDTPSSKPLQEQPLTLPETTTATAAPMSDPASAAASEANANDGTSQNISDPPQIDKDYGAQAQESLESVLAILRQLESFSAEN